MVVCQLCVALANIILNAYVCQSAFLFATVVWIVQSHVTGWFWVTLSHLVLMLWQTPCVFSTYFDALLCNQASSSMFLLFGTVSAIRLPSWLVVMFTAYTSLLWNNLLSCRFAGDQWLLACKQISNCDLSTWNYWHKNMQAIVQYYASYHTVQVHIGNQLSKIPHCAVSVHSKVTRQASQTGRSQMTTPCPLNKLNTDAHCHVSLRSENVCTDKKIWILFASPYNPTMYQQADHPKQHNLLNNMQ